jgi:hypothetical protein
MGPLGDAIQDAVNGIIGGVKAALRGRRARADAKLDRTERDDDDDRHRLAVQEAEALTELRRIIREIDFAHALERLRAGTFKKKTPVEPPPGDRDTLDGAFRGE